MLGNINLLNKYFLICFLASNSLHYIYCKSTELTFELSDNARECFYETIKDNTSTTLHYQVFSGGNYDIDFVVLDPENSVLFKQTKTQSNSYTFTTQKSGIYTFCFSNEFSTFSHKLIFMALRVGSLRRNNTMPMTKMESLLDYMQRLMKRFSEIQIDYRLQESNGRKRAEGLNKRVLWWSMAQTLAIVAISMGQVFVLKNFFK